MLYALFVLGVSLGLLLGGMLGGRMLAAPRGSPRLRVALGYERDVWVGTSFARRAGFAAAGLLGFYVVTGLILTAGYLSSGQATIDETSMRVFVASGGPADLAGLRDGDRVLSVNGEASPDWDTLKKLVSSHKGEPVTLAIDREGQPLTISATPGPNGKLLIGPPTGHSPVGVGHALVEGFGSPVKVWLTTIRSLKRFVTGSERPEVTGPAGIVRETGKAASSSFGAAMQLVGVMAAYFFWAPVLVTLVAFPRGRRRAT